MHERFLAVYCSVLYCSILQHTAPLFYIMQYSREGTITLTNAPAISCSVLQCIILQYTATYCTIILHNAIFYRGHHYFGKCTCNFNRHEACVNAQYESHNIFLFGNDNHRIYIYVASVSLLLSLTHAHTHFPNHICIYMCMYIYIHIYVYTPYTHIYMYTHLSPYCYRSKVGSLKT